jgi:hypothetical protein
VGEYALLSGREVKIGTCENMYYLRFDQRHMVEPKPGNVDPVRDATSGIRFRFPWPHEDGTAPGAFEDYDKAVAVHGLRAPDGVEHGIVQFTARGYNVCLPCPEGPGADKDDGLSVRRGGLRVHRNGFTGAVLISQQRLLEDGTLALIARCGGCGYAWRYSTVDDVRPVLLAIAKQAERNSGGASAEWWGTVAERIASGYGVSVVDVIGRKIGEAAQ